MSKPVNYRAADDKSETLTTCNVYCQYYVTEDVALHVLTGPEAFDNQSLVEQLLGHFVVVTLD